MVLKNNNKHIAMPILLAFAVFLFLGLYGCSANENPTEHIAGGQLADETPAGGGETPAEPKITLTLAAMGVPRETSNAVAEFNKTNELYHIEIVNYGDYDASAGLQLLLTEINSGQVPDLFCATSLPYSELAANGLFADLYQFLDADAELGRDDFVGAALRAFEVDGELLQISPAFSISTIIGHPSVLGPGGWNIYEFMEIIEAHPEADIQAGGLIDKLTLLNMAVTSDIGSFIDYDAGTASFDTPEFIRLLELIDRYPGAIDFRDSLTSARSDPPESAIPSGRQIMLYLYASNFYGILDYNRLFGGEIVFKGFPVASRDGNAINAEAGIAISRHSPHKEIAWEFVRTLLNGDMQQAAFPTNSDAFNSVVEDVTEWLYYQYDLDVAFDDEGELVRDPEVERRVQRDIGAILDAIDSAGFAGLSSIVSTSVAQDIINESAEDYFRGGISAEDAAQIIQSRLELHVSEQG